MSAAAIPAYDLPVLLEAAGAHPRGNRHDCSKCGGFRTVTNTEDCFYCHKCQWKGNSILLARELGLTTQLTPAQYRDLQQNRERAQEAARRLYVAVHSRRLELLEELYALNRIEAQAHEAGPDHPATWGALAVVYQRRPTALAELQILENGGTAELFRFVSASPEDLEAAGSLRCDTLCPGT
jgi:hypothetical protein